MCVHVRALMMYGCGVHACRGARVESGQVLRAYAYVVLGIKLRLDTRLVQQPPHAEPSHQPPSTLSQLHHCGLLFLDCSHLTHKYYTTTPPENNHESSPALWTLPFQVPLYLSA